MNTCNDCPLRATCTALCPEVEALLPHEDHARVHAFYRRNAAAWARRFEAERAAARALTDYRHLLRGRERQVFDLVYNEALGQSEAAAQLGITRRVAGHYLTRARRKIARHLGALPR